MSSLIKSVFELPAILILVARHQLCICVSTHTHIADVQMQVLIQQVIYEWQILSSNHRECSNVNKGEQSFIPDQRKKIYKIFIFIILCHSKTFCEMLQLSVKIKMYVISILKKCFGAFRTLTFFTPLFYLFATVRDINLFHTIVNLFHTIFLLMQKSLN